ncbi:unnamed protein product [Scytosiphon promiscuus]
MPPSLARGGILALVLLAVLSHVESIKRPFGAQTPAAKKRVKVSFDDESFSFWDPFKDNGFNASSIVPIAQELGRRGPGYLAYAAVSTGLGLFLPPKVTTAVNIAYVVSAVARSYESGDNVETFCREEGRVLLGMPSLHIAAVGSTLRALRFRLWRRLFVKATLFRRIVCELRFMRIYRPRWVTGKSSPLTLVVQDTAHAARNVQGLFPDLCHQAAFVAAGCGVPYWSECNPPPRVEKRWSAKRRLDRRLRREFGTRARRARPWEDSPRGVGLLGWRIPHRVVLGTIGLVLKPFRSNGGSSPSPKLLEITEGKAEAKKDDDVAAPREYAAALVGGGKGTARGDAGSTPPSPSGGGALPAKGPLVRFHNVTAIASPGSTLTKSYRALAELPYGDGKSGPKDDLYLLFPAKPSSTQGWEEAAAAVEDFSREADSGAQQKDDPATPAAAARKKARRQLQPVVIKRNIRRQLRLAEEDVAEARKVLRRLTFESDIDLDTSGVLAEVSAAVARAGDLREEAESIERVRSNLARAGMLGSAVGVPEVLTCPELGPLARGGILVTTALRGVDVSDAYVMQHAAPKGESERDRFVEGVFAAFGQMCLADGCFPSNPMPDNLLYMSGEKVGLTDLSSVSQLTDKQRRALCRLYRTLAELEDEDAGDPSDAAEVKARAAMESVGLVIDLPPAGGTPRTPAAAAAVPSSSTSTTFDLTRQEEAALAVARAAESVIDATFGGDGTLCR